MCSLGDDTGWVSPPSVLSQLVPKLSRNYLKEGYMEKTGPKVGRAVRFQAYSRSAILLLCLEGGLGAGPVDG